MIDESNNEIWIFLSHSNKDYEKVRLVRNRLEDKQLRPLMFFLHCLNDEEELDSLIKREIDCRTRFILCDSENARESKWVQKEVEYILSKDRVCETIDLRKTEDEIMDSLDDFIHKTKLFISYNREESNLADAVYKRLIQYDFSVYMDRLYVKGEPYTQKNYVTLKKIEDYSISGGYVISIMNERILHNLSDSRKEIIKAIKNNVSVGNTIPNIIPFVTKKDIIKGITQDEKLQILTDCGIHSLEGLDEKQRCDMIMSTVLHRLMTPGSIKVQADNFARGVNGTINKAEAEFLYGLLDSNP